MSSLELPLLLSLLVEASEDVVESLPRPSELLPVLAVDIIAAVVSTASVVVLGSGGPVVVPSALEGCGMITTGS